MTEPAGTRIEDPDRLQALYTLDLLDTPPDPDFDRWTRHVREALDAKASLVTLIDRDRQFFKSASGFGNGNALPRETPLEYSFCKHVVDRSEPLVVSDARTHPLLEDNPAVERFGVVAYAGFPLWSRSGHVLGAISALETEPRSWSERDLTILEGCASAVSTEIELAARERRTRTVARAISDVVSLIEEDGTVRYVSPSITPVLGWSPEVRTGGRISDLVHPADAEALADARARVVERPGESLDLTVRARTTGGEYRWLETRLTNLLDDPVIQGILSIARDVTDREEALARLRESEERFRTLVEGAFDAILVVDEEGRIGYMSPATERILGRPVEERLGASAFETLHPDDAAKARAGLEAVLADPEGTARGELRVRHAEGGWTTLEVVARNFLDHPAVQGVVINLRDITERRELESRLLQAQKMEAVGRLAGGVAHDFNNLLTAIGGTADLLLEDLPDAADQRDDIATIRHMADRASQLTRQLLAFSRQQILQPRLLDLADQVRRTESMLRRLIRENVEFRLDLPDEPVPILLDPLQVEQILVNLAVNARDAMPQGGRLTLGVDTRTGPGGDEAVLTVEDTGHGMSSETLARAFEPFFTTKPTGEGTGLGLATVYGIVEQSGGSVEAESEPGEGTRVVVRFPLAPPNGLESPPSPAAPEPEPGEGVVLVVEDEDSVRHLLERILARAGYTVLSASHGPGALELSDARDRPIDVLVTDVVMPGMNGIEVAAELTRRRPSLQVLYISGYASEEHELTRRVEEDRFLPKPFTPQELLDAVRGLVAARGRITPR